MTTSLVNGSVVVRLLTYPRILPLKTRSSTPPPPPTTTTTPHTHTHTHAHSNSYIHSHSNRHSNSHSNTHSHSHSHSNSHSPHTQTATRTLGEELCEQAGQVIKSGGTPPDPLVPLEPAKSLPRSLNCYWLSTKPTLDWTMMSHVPWPTQRPRSLTVPPSETPPWCVAANHTQGTQGCGTASAWVSATLTFNASPNAERKQAVQPLYSPNTCGSYQVSFQCAPRRIHTIVHLAANRPDLIPARIKFGARDVALVVLQ